MAKHLVDGRNAELQAKRYLLKQGLKYLDSNYRCKSGEIDIIMNDGEQLVFVEVRYRNRTDFGSAIETITAGKQKKLIAAAQHYLLTSGRDQPCRFDVVGVDGGNRINWVKNAFQS